MDISITSDDVFLILAVHPDNPAESHRDSDGNQHFSWAYRS